MKEANGHCHGDADPDRGGRWGHDDGPPAYHGHMDPFQRGMDPFDHGRRWQDGDGGHRHHPSSQMPANDDDGLIAVAGGSAAASGDSSTVAGFVENVAQDRGSYSIAVGEAVFEASARSHEPGALLALADTFLVVSDADFVFEYENVQTRQHLDVAWARAELDYVAIDIHGWSPRHGPVVLDLYQALDGHAPFGGPPDFGNFAHALAVAETDGPGSLSATFTHTLTLDGQFSFVQAMAMVTL